VAAELSRIVNLDDLSGSQAVFEILATEPECTALAQRFGLEAIESFAATVRLKRTGQAEIMFSAEITVSLTQTCVVTLEFFQERLQCRAELHFGPSVPDDASGPVDFLAGDDLEPLPDDDFDIGEIAATEFYLTLDPFPRHPDLERLQQDPETALIHEEIPEKPLAALEGLLRKD